MTTFVLKKYENKEKEDKPEEEKEEVNNNKELLITIKGTISEIVSNALNKVLKKSNIIIEEDPEDKPTDNIIVTTEDINIDPIEVFKNIPKGSTLYIQNNGFKTAKEEWFLTNLKNKEVDVCYTLESFIRKLEDKFN